MIDNEKDFLCLVHLPTRLTAQQASWYIGVTVDDVTTLMQHRLLPPMGRPTQTMVKHFNKNKLVRLCQSHKWMDQVEICLAEYWIKKNERRGGDLKGRPLSSRPPKSGHS